MTTDYDEHRNALLVYLHETEHKDIDGFLAERGLNAERARELVKDMEQDGLVQPLFGAGGIPACHLTGRGEQRAQQINKERPARRLGVLRQKMLAWLEAHRDLGDWSSFMSSGHIHHDDGDFTWDDVEREAAYLSDSGLIRAHPADQLPDGMIQPRLTQSGRDCVLHHDGDVQNYAAGGRDSSATSTTNYFAPVITGAVTNSQFASGNSVVTQNQQNTMTKAPEQYRELARIVTLLLEQLPDQRGVDNEHREDIEAAAHDVLTEVAEAEEPEPGKVRRATKALSGTLLHFGQAAAAGAAAGTRSGAQDWAQDAITALSALTF